MRKAKESIQNDAIIYCVSLLSSCDRLGILMKKISDILPRYLQDVTSSRHLQDVLPRSLQDVFKTSLRRPAKMSSRHLQDVLQRCLQDFFKTYQHVKLFLLTSLRHIFNTFLRHTAKTMIYRMIGLGRTSEKFMVSVQI